MISFQEIFSSYKKCRFGKPYSRQQAYFEIELSKKLVDLTESLNSKTYKFDVYNFFIITHPKPREIFAAHFKDRILHHYLVSKLTPIWEKKFSDASFACREGKGTHAAIRKFCQNVHTISQGGTKQVYVLQMDLKQFFASIHRPTLLKLYHKYNPYKELSWLIDLVIAHDARTKIRRFKLRINDKKAEINPIPKEKSWFSKPADFGIPIGNLTSQFGANMYLNDCDHFIQRTLKPAGYLRYMDDLTFIDTDAQKLECIIRSVTEWLFVHRKLEINSQKTKLTLLKNGIDLLGYHVKQVGPYNAYSTAVLAPKSKKWNFVKSIRTIRQKDILKSQVINPLCRKRVSPETLSKFASINSKIGHLQHAKTFLFRKRALDKLIKYTALNAGRLKCTNLVTRCLAMARQ